MDLPEVTGVHPPGTADGVLGDHGRRCSGGDDHLLPSRADEGLHLLSPGCGDGRHVGKIRVGDPAPVDCDDLAAAVPVQPWTPVGGGGKSHPASPVEPVGVTRNRLDFNVPGESGQALQLLLDNRGEHRALTRQRDVLEVATAAGARTGIRARGLHSIRRLHQHIHGVCTEKSRPGVPFGDRDADTLTGDRMTDEDDAAVVSSDMMAAVGHRPHVDDEVGAHKRVSHRSVSPA